MAAHPSDPHTATHPALFQLPELCFLFPLPQMMRLLGHVPRRLVAASRRGPEFFNAQCQLWDAPRPPYWPMDKVLQEWHGLPEDEVGCCGKDEVHVWTGWVQCWQRFPIQLQMPCRPRLLRAPASHAG